ncbi:kinase-like protein [Penicillium hispanicum]|uniref:kinase-like protein n=1 Tax=Penicillium hispanicum TaxID=1080232 RepID=UPI00254173DA|nr:kinase-like protein [Penicillium hispanicum]KAJ5594732.1 kinase-like protein [Penicillium hispanicum]
MLGRLARRQSLSLSWQVFPLCKRQFSMSTSTTRDLFAYTSGRFLYNEEARLRERYVQFDPDGLRREVERHIGSSHGPVGEITKIGEGGFNRVLLLTMHDGFEAIVKIPYHIAGPRYFATASEAATLQFLYSQGIPVPRLYGYSPSNENPAGTEYIIMEKAAGVGLETIWLEMSKRERHKLASGFVEIEKKFFSLPFGSTGSIYFKDDIPPKLQAPLYHEASTDSKMFCIGPTADYMFWRGKRASLDIFRGPWADPCGYLMSIAQKEIEWVRQYGKPLKLDFPHNGSTPGEVSPDEYVHLLEKFLLLAPYLLPKDLNSPLNQPTLRHPVAGHPRAFENPDLEQSPDLKEPSLPSDYEGLPVNAKAEADELYRRRLLFYYYRIFNGHLNKPHLQALRDPLLLPRQHLVDRAGRQWNGNVMTLKGALVRMVEYWPHLPDTRGIACPVEFTDAELDGFAEQEQMWFDLNKLVNYWRDEIGINEEGWVSNDRYEDAVRKTAQLKDSLVEAAEGDEEDIRLLNEGWMFRDREEID